MTPFSSNAQDRAFIGSTAIRDRAVVRTSRHLWPTAIIGCLLMIGCTGQAFAQAANVSGLMQVASVAQHIGKAIVEAVVQLLYGWFPAPFAVCLSPAVRAAASTKRQAKAQAPDMGPETPPACVSPSLEATYSELMGTRIQHRSGDALTAEERLIIKIVDWGAMLTASIALFISGTGALLFFFANVNTVLQAIVFMLGAVASTITLTQRLAGVVFDFGDKTIVFYTYWTRRTVYIGELRDANCEFGLRSDPTAVLFSVFSAAAQKSKRNNSSQFRTYMVNLSGSFGSEQVRFSDKRWRDHFLSVLRDAAPHCRITRWR